MTVTSSQTEGFYDKRYSDEWRQLQDRVFGEVYDDYFGQSSLTSTADYDRIFGWLSVGSGAQVLDVACGGGAPALRLAGKTGCSVTGIDINANAVALAQGSARQRLSSNIKFVLHDANARLPFTDGSFDALVCVDALAHIGNHEITLGDWRRVLRPGGRMVFTDSVMTGPISNEEIANRSASGPIVVVPPGYEERCLLAAGLTLERREDLTPTLERIARKHVEARARHADELLKLEGQATFETLNRYRANIELLARERRLSHIAFFATR